MKKLIILLMLLTPSVHADQGAYLKLGLFDSIATNGICNDWKDNVIGQIEIGYTYKINNLVALQTSYQHQSCLTRNYGELPIESLGVSVVIKLGG